MRVNHKSIFKSCDLLISYANPLGVGPLVTVTGSL